MKKIVFISLFFISLIPVFGQKFEKIKALKTAFITDRLDLSATEAEKFWPVYNQYEKELHQLQVVNRLEILNQVSENGDVNNLSEKVANDMLQKVMDLQDKIHITEKNKLIALKKVMSAQKILKLVKLEENFKRELFKMLQEQRTNNRK